MQFGMRCSRISVLPELVNDFVEGGPVLWRLRPAPAAQIDAEQVACSTGINTLRAAVFLSLVVRRASGVPERYEPPPNDSKSEAATCSVGSKHCQLPPT